MTDLNPAEKTVFGSKGASSLTPYADRIRHATCQWIDADPRISAKKCGDPVTKKDKFRSYCEPHWKRCWKRDAA